MQYRKESDGTYVVNLERGDDLRQSIEDLAQREDIVGAMVSGIGAVKDPELGYYDLATKQYIRKSFNGIWELTPLTGNITILKNKPFLHAHVVISGRDFIAYGGHLFEATTGVVVELIILPLAKVLHRIHCEDIGLARWEPCRLLYPE